MSFGVGLMAVGVLDLLIAFLVPARYRPIFRAPNPVVEAALGVLMLVVGAVVLVAS